MFDATSPNLRERLQTFLSAHWRETVQLSNLRRLTAGMSWITLVFTARIGDSLPVRELIVRVGDPGGLLAPYSARPEYLALTSLAGITDLPIPQAYVYCDDADVIGAPFMVTQWVEGDTPMPWKGADSNRGEAANRSIGHDFADALGAIHAFDWARSPLAELCGSMTRENVAVRQIEYWARHAEVPGDRAPAQMHYAWRWLQAHTPVADRISVVHGDYRVGNFLQRSGRITAILDWELVHLGDAHEDLAWVGSRTFSGGTTRIGGLIERDVFYARHATRSGLQIHPERVRYYEVLVQFKMAAMLVGAIRRIESGRAQDVRMASMGFQLAPTLLELNRLIEEAR